MQFRDVLCIVDNFDRAQTLSTTPGMNGWTQKVTKTAGSPAAVCISGGGLQMSLDTTSEAQVLTVDQNDVLSIPASQLQIVRIHADVSGVGAHTTVLLGMATAENDAEGSVAEYSLFAIKGATNTGNVVVDTNDGTVANANLATGQTLGSTTKEFVMDFTNGLNDIRFYIDGQRVAASSTLISMALAASTLNLQPYFQVAKTTGAEAPVVKVRRFELSYKRVLGA